MTLWISKGGGCDRIKRKSQMAPALYDNPTVEKTGSGSGGMQVG